MTVSLAAVAAETRQRVQSFELPLSAKNAWAVVFDRNLSSLAVENESGLVAVYSVNQSLGVPCVEFPGTAEDFTPEPFFINKRSKIVFVSNGRQLLVARGTNLTAFDPATGRIVRHLESSDHPIDGLQISRDGSRVAALVGQSLPMALAFWDAESGRINPGFPTSRFPGAPKSGSWLSTGSLPLPGMCRAMSHDGRFFAVGGERRRIDLWDLDRKTLVSSTKSTVSAGYVTALAIGASNQIAAVINSFELHRLDSQLKTDTVLFTPSTITTERSRFVISAIAVSGDGQRIAIAGMRVGSRPGFFGGAGEVVWDVPIAGEVQLWDTLSGKRRATFSGRADEKFLEVALDVSGSKIAAVAAGVHYRPAMTGAMQQSEELRPNKPVRISVWEFAELVDAFGSKSASE